MSLALAAGFALNAAAAEPKTAMPSLESIEWCDIWISHANETNLPRVLLIGDSITQGIQIQAAQVAAQVERVLLR